ncbi:hypothetical protein K3495_g1723 [Podosphaera aphanis]|nr:hypothetical protein K3495_g1723 [Podosphaera aphanis]
MDSSDIPVKAFKNKGQFFKARMIRLWTDFFVRGEALLISRRGRHPKRNSLIHDEDVKFACLEYLRSIDPQKLTPEVLMIHINTVILSIITKNPDLEISKRTPYGLLALLGYKEYDRKKGISSDGLDRDDVVLIRHEFIRRMAEYTPLKTKWIEDGTGGLIAQQPALSDNQKQHVLVVQDECIFCANDSRKSVWATEVRMPLLKKREGKSIMESNYLFECHGQPYRKVAGQKKWVREVLTPGNGKSDDGWWKCEHMIKQLQDSVFLSFEELYPGRTAVFSYDNSMNHKNMPPHGLNVTQLNLSDGGKNSRVSCRDDFFQNRSVKK